ncbi:hypothetical protein NHP21005_09530 [Helicobacter sp. NHP21005]|uniref:replication initiation protein n=1 Tax=Helicobacter felistomachi TaxID=3040201 RepID=UPI0025728731|nr:replication initiation protein [Helicobacter sp. NHP21005]BEG57265.1 hypothetical protein NHP21005_09530 [Helicobacter sp. NHP21005]
MDKNYHLCQQLKALRYDLDALIILELQHANSPTKLATLFVKKAEVVREMAQVVLKNEWDSDNTTNTDTLQDTLKKLKHFTGLITNLENMLPKTTRPDIKQDLEDSVKDCIENMQTALTTWMDCVKREDTHTFNPRTTETTIATSFTTQVTQIAPTEVDSSPNTHQTPPPLPTHLLQEAAEETPQRESQLSPVTQKAAQPLQTVENLIGDDVEYAPVLAKNTKIANPKQVVVHNNIYKVNLGMLGELENNLLFSLFNRLKDKKDTVLRFNPKELKTLMGDPKMNNKELYKAVKQLFNNIAGANFDAIKYLPDQSMLVDRVMFFRRFTMKLDKNKNVEYLDIQVNDPYFTYLLNDLEANFTTMQLQTFVDLSGKYTKNLFRLLERFKNATDKRDIFKVHVYENNLEGFCAFMGIPKTFKVGDIDNYVLKPTLKQLTQKTKKLSHFEPPYKSIKVIKNKARERGVQGY